MKFTGSCKKHTLIFNNIRYKPILPILCVAIFLADYDAILNTISDMSKFNASRHEIHYSLECGLYATFTVGVNVSLVLDICGVLNGKSSLYCIKLLVYFPFLQLPIWLRLGSECFSFFSTCFEISTCKLIYTLCMLTTYILRESGLGALLQDQE